MNRLNKIMADPEVYKCIFSGIKPHFRSNATKPETNYYWF